MTVLKNISIVVILGFLFVLSACHSDKKGGTHIKTDIYSTPVTINHKRFVDGFGRQVIFNGINLGNKNPAQNYIGEYDNPEIFKNFKKWGFNVIRLGIIWAGLEPEPGKYNEDYFKAVDRQIALAEQNGLFVFLDMHQDLYSVLYSDGAPEWATLHEDKPHVKGTIWSDAYLISPAVQTAWDNFWNNAKAEDGIGLQDHYAALWRLIAEHYKNNHVVIGYDLMNEPFVGSEAQLYMPALFQAFSEVIKQEGKDLSIKEIGQMWLDEESRYKALSLIATREKYEKVIRSVYRINSKFEKGLLQNFYQKVADSIRTVDSTKFLFLDHSYFCNMGVPTALEPVKLKNGKPDPKVVYAAHAYDLLVDTRYLSKSGDERLDLIFETIDKSANRMGVPVLIGEWGALGKDGEGKARLAEEHLKTFEKYLFSNTYWAYDKQLSGRKYFKALLHPYPEYVSGKLIEYHYNREQGKFYCRWQESKSVSKPTIIYIPNVDKIEMDEITVLPEGDGIVLESMDNSLAGYVVIEPSGTSGEREISFAIRQNEEKEVNLTYN